ncbi:MAG: ATP-binding protein [Chloroflexi bacterium]|nr:ATP-binding protein [Chloroflexota bacterium]
MVEEARVPIRSETDILLARQQGRQMAAALGLTVIDQVATATAISELARNIVQYATSGEIVLRIIELEGRRGIVVIAQDGGPGISDIQRVLRGGYSTSGGLGLGVSGTRRLMDEFEIDSQIGKGTTVTVKKWKT